MDLDTIFRILLVLAAANGGPMFAQDLLKHRWARPIDGGLHLADGRPLLGHSKTWRGLVAGTVLAAMLAPLLGWTWWLGAWFGLWSLIGDLLSSFIKRRLGFAPSSRATGLDQIPEVLLPCWTSAPWLDLNTAEVLTVLAVFFAGEVVLSPLLYRFHIRRRPY